MSYPKTGKEVYVSLNLSNTMLTGIGKGTITRENVSADYLKDLFAKHGVIVSCKPEQRALLERMNETYDFGLEIPETCDAHPKRFVLQPSMKCRKRSFAYLHIHAGYPVQSPQGYRRADE